MAKVVAGRQTIPLDEVVLAQALQLDTLLNVLERKDLLAKTEVLDEIKQLRRTAEDEIG